jgi:ABC-type transport system involved in multi-copper enzyme maturation permease subunit
MRRPRVSLGLPLLMRELTEQSSRGRHYVLRTLFATVLLLLGYLFLSDLLASGGNQGGMWSLGNGPELFDLVVELEALGILIFLPAMTCGAIAGEKERNTLSVLLTTRLGPATIVLEKLLSRLFLIFTLLLLSLPLLAVAYSLGGLSLDYMIECVVWLLATSLLVASLSLMCSAWCGSTVSAFFMTYALAFVLYLGGLSFVAVPKVAKAGFGMGTGIPLPTHWALFWGVLVPSAIFFVVTVRCLVRRAAVTPRNFVLSFFRWLDELYNRMNVVTGNIVLTPATSSLPETAPIAWRETAKKSLGTVRYLVRVFVAIELPTAILLIIAAESRFTMGRSAGIGSALWIADWGVAAALISVMCAGIVSGERTRQTLPVLLATPIPGDEIIKQLFAGVRRLIMVLWLPFATIALFDAWYHVGQRFMTQLATTEWLVCSVLELAIYPFLIAWITFYVGAKVRSPLWAIVAALSTVSGVVVVPYLIVWILAVCDLNPGPELGKYVSLASPGMIIVENEFSQATLTMSAVNFLFFGGVLIVVRRLCLRRADRLLGRAEPQLANPQQQSVAPVRDETQMAPA